MEGHWLDLYDEWAVVALGCTAYCFIRFFNELYRKAIGKLKEETEGMPQEQKQFLVEQVNNPDIKDIGDVSDGYHTFNSLYRQRLYLWAALVKAYKDKAWKSKCHHDGEPCFGGGWFIVGITTPAGDYTYHYELKDWNLFDCKVLDKAPEFDGHTDKDVTRVLTL